MATYSDIFTIRVDSGTFHTESILSSTGIDGVTRRKGHPALAPILPVRLGLVRIVIRGPDQDPSYSQTHPQRKASGGMGSL